MPQRNKLIVGLPLHNPEVWRGGANYLDALNDALEVLAQNGEIELLSEDKFAKSKAGSELLIQMPWKFANKRSKILNWIPDMQDIDLPELFPIRVLLRRRFSLLLKILRQRFFYFSSATTKEKFHSRYPVAKIAGVVRFAIKPGKEFIFDKIHVCLDCEINGFIYSPNQWWTHKNHVFLITAYEYYVRAGGKLHLVLSGAESDYRQYDYSKKIMGMIGNFPQHIHNLSELPRQKQLYLYKACKFVVQPSLYEGWSFSIEESIYFNRNIICLPLKNNIEQAEGANGIFFVSGNSISELSDSFFKLEQHSNPINDKVVYKRWERFLEDLVKTLNN
jgi:glycosyltransferase involved in cell wall biosynthesis